MLSDKQRIELITAGVPLQDDVPQFGKLIIEPEWHIFAPENIADQVLALIGSRLNTIREPASEGRVKIFCAEDWHKLRYFMLVVKTLKLDEIG